MQIPQMRNMQAQAGPQPAGFLDQFGTNVGNAIMGANNPFGLSVSPQDRKQQIGMALLKMAGDVDGTARRGGSALEGLSTGIGNMQQQGMDSATKLLWARQQQHAMKLQEQQMAGQEAMRSNLMTMLQPGQEQQGAPMDIPPSVQGERPGMEQPMQPGQPQQGISGKKRAEAMFWLQAGQPDKAAATIFGDSDPASWQNVTLDDGVYMVNSKDPSQRLKIGERADRNEGEGREFSQEDKLRKDFTVAAKPFQDLRVNFQRMKAASQDETGASDIAMVYSFMKMLDPTSVVREGEFATAQNAGGVDSQVIAMYNKILSGERLAPQVRKDFMQQSNRQFEQQMQSYEQTKKTFQGMAKSYGLNPERVTPDLTFGVTPDKPEEGGWTTLPNGIRIRKKN